MPISDPELIPYLIFLLFLAIALDVALILAWRRYNRRKKRMPRIPSESRSDRSGWNPASWLGSFRRRAASAGPAVTSNPPAQLSGSSAPSAVSAPQHAIEASAPAETSQAGTTFGESSQPPAATRVQVTVDLPPGEAVRVTIESLGAGGKAPLVTTERFPGKAASQPAAMAHPPGSSRVGQLWAPVWRRLSAAWAGFWNSARTTEGSLFLLALGIYLLVRIIGLAQWPIYFFTDEAVQTNFAAELWNGGLTWHNGEVLPTFFENAGQYEMNFSVYVQLIPYLIFGKSVFVNRLVSVLVTVLGMAAVGWMLRRAFKMPRWWSGILVLSLFPAWFLHSRTSFESAEAVAFYALFLFFYMLYRSENPRYLYPALISGALCGYTYSPALMVMLVSGVLLAISDLRYHWRHRKTALLGILLLAFCALPYIRFLVEHPTANKDQLAIVGSLWLRDAPFLGKLQVYLAEWAKGFDPRYWYLPVPPDGVYADIVRHLMKGYGHIPLWTLPFGLAGLLIALRNIRSSAFRTLWIALIAAPSGAALAQITVTRSLFVVLPVALFTTLGINWCLTIFEAPGGETPAFLEGGRTWVRRLLARMRTLRGALESGTSGRSVRAFAARWSERARAALGSVRGLARVPRFALSLGLFVSLASVNGYMLWDALANGPTWYTEYQLYGMQYGGEQISAALREYRAQHPEANFIVSTSWANGTDELFKFFLPEGFAYRAGTVDEYMQNGTPIGAEDVFLMTSGEYERAQASNRFAEIHVEKTIPNPDGTIGYYFARLRFIPGILEIIQAEKEEQARPVEETITLNGIAVLAVHSRFDNGSMASAFDRDQRSLIRTQTANPMVLDLTFDVPLRITAVDILIGGGPTRLTARVEPAAGGEAVEQSVEVPRSTYFRVLTLTLTDPVESAALHLEILTVGEGEPNHVHVYEMRLEAAGWESGPVLPAP